MKNNKESQKQKVQMTFKARKLGMKKKAKLEKRRDLHDELIYKGS